MYERMASMFNQHWSFWGGADCWPAVINRAVQKTGGGKWLDVCCGTGHLLQMVQMAGFEATGVDMSETVLSYAQLNAPKARLVEGNVKKLRVFENYNVISCMGASMNLFKSNDSIRKVFQGITKHLNENGLIVFDASTKEGMKCNVGREFHFNDDRGDYIATISFNDELNQGEWQIKASYKQAHRYNNQRMSCIEKLKPWDIDELVPLMGEFGLNVETIDADTLDPINEETVRVVYYCERIEG